MMAQNENVLRTNKELRMVLDNQNSIGGESELMRRGRTHKLSGNAAKVSIPGEAGGHCQEQKQHKKSINRNAG